MGQNRIKMSPCPHLGSQHASMLEIKKLEKVKSCALCDYSGPNLWICLQRNCLRVGCSEQANDHSTEHFQRNNNHCLHLNMSSQRAWCYLCEHEVLLDGIKPSSPPLIQDQFTTTIRSSSTLNKEDSSNDDETVTTSVGLVGLQNIANTCYMNSALQALSNVTPMTHYFLNCSDLIDHILEQGPQRSKVGLAKSYQRLIRDIWRTNDGDYIAPRSILYGIRSVHPMFRGFQQHDTQEFLRCFMDQLHEELKEQSPTLPLAIGLRSTTTSNEQKQHDDLSNIEEDSLSQCSMHSHCSSLSDDTEYETCDSSLSENHSNVHTGTGHSRRTRRNVSNTVTHQSQSQPQSQSSPSIRSIISDVFDGKLLSSVQCLTCDRLSSREETFQDLSLPIPNRDYLNVLHQTHSLSAQSLNSIDSTAARNEEGWLSWLWNMFRSWLWGPSVTLHDCMASFFSADELKGDNMYSCEKCNKLRTGVKYSQILDLPEVLCIHLKRFRHDLSYSSKISSPVHFPIEGLDMRPYLHKDCKSHVTLYNLVSVICHHGTVGGGHYTCFARNGVTNRWYEFDDQHVNEVPATTVQNCQAYVLFYSKHNPQMELVRIEANDLSLSNPVHLADIRFYVAREWLSRFSTFAEPGPINNWTILCPHGGLLQSKIELLSQIAVPISQPLWDFLYRKFGGGPAINMLFECEVCKRAAEALARRQYYELSVFTKYNGMDTDMDSSAIFAISMPWLRKWQQFARGLTHKEPGQISNAIVATPERHVRPGSDYAQINAPLWRFLHGIYGGGPEIIIRGSISEEIEIIDQDEYDDDHDCLINHDLSDTESNMDNRINTPVLQETSQPTQPVEFVEMKNGDRNSEAVRLHYNNSRDSKSNKHFFGNGRKAKAAILRSNLRKKSMKGRNAMKNADFFGPKGHYNVQKSCDVTENDSTEILDAHSTDDLEIKRNAFRKKSKHHSFQYEKNHKTHIKTNSFSESADTSIDDVDSSCNVYIRGKSRRKGSRKGGILLQNFSQLHDSNVPNEADV